MTKIKTQTCFCTDPVGSPDAAFAVSSPPSLGRPFFVHNNVISQGGICYGQTILQSDCVF